MTALRTAGATVACNMFTIDHLFNRDWSKTEQTTIQLKMVAPSRYDLIIVISDFLNY